MNWVEAVIVFYLYSVKTVRAERGERAVGPTSFVGAGVSAVPLLSAIFCSEITWLVRPFLLSLLQFLPCLGLPSLAPPHFFFTQTDRAIFLPKAMSSLCVVHAFCVCLRCAQVTLSFVLFCFLPPLFSFLSGFFAFAAHTNPTDPTHRRTEPIDGRTKNRRGDLPQG